MFAAALKKFTDNHRLVTALDFVLDMLVIYLLWKIFLHWVNIPGSALNAHWLAFNDWLAAKIILPVAWILKHVFGYKLFYNGRNIIVDGTQGLYVANHCLGIPPAVIFSGFIIAYQGRWLHKIWFIPFGVLCIYLTNVVRVIALAITEKYWYRVFFELAHSWVYLLMSYGIFFLLVMWWMNKLSKK